MNNQTKLRQFMSQRGITNNLLSRGTEIPYVTVTKYVYGEVKNPSMANIKKITDFLGCSFEDVF